MFTVKFYAEPNAEMANATGHYEGTVFIIEAEEVEILPPTPSYDYYVRAKTRNGFQSRAIRYLTDEERAKQAIAFSGEETYIRAIIENSNGKTTQILHARQKEPPVMQSVMPMRRG